MPSVMCIVFKSIEQNINRGAETYTDRVRSLLVNHSIYFRTFNEDCVVMINLQCPYAASIRFRPARKPIDTCYPLRPWYRVISDIRDCVRPRVRTLKEKKTT